MNLKNLDSLLQSNKSDSEKLRILAEGFREEYGDQDLHTNQADYIISNAPFPIFAIDLDLTVRKVNQAFLDLTGFTQGEIIGMNFKDFKILEREGESAKDAIHKKIRVEGQVVVDCPAGIRSFGYSYLPNFDENGAVTSLTCFYQDHTSTKESVADILKLTEAARHGDLDARIDVDKFKGDFRLLADGINNILDAVIGPPNVAAEYVDRISKGDIPLKITDAYNGDFNEIKNNLNQCIDAVNLLVSDTFLLSDAAVKGKFDTRADATKHQGDFRKVVEGVNSTLDSVIGPLNVAAEYVDRISKGDIPPRITDTYNGDFNEIKNNLNTCIDAVNLLVVDAKVLNDAAVKGKLDTRADSTKHQGDFRKIVEGVNETLDSVIGPLNVAAEYVNRISKGDVPPKITDSYNGDFNEIKNNLNTCIDAVSLLIRDAELLSEAAVNGKLGTRADATRHQGDFRRIVEGVNHTLDAVIGPLNVAAGYVDRIAKGDIPAKIVDAYNGDFNEIKNNLNLCIESINALIRDAELLSEAAIKGKLATRADSTKHHGDFRKIVEGVNDTLDAVIGPLNITAGYVDRISKGDIPPKIVESYNGDFNEIKNNLNQCIEAVSLLVGDANLLSQAAVKGKLDIRADATKHQGDFRKIVEGVNGTLDSVIGPLNVAAEYVDRISKGDIPPKISDTYNGDFNEIKNNLNQCIDAVNLLIGDTNLLSDAAVKGKLDTRADATKHLGDFRKIVEGVNETLDSVIGPLNVAAEYVDRISKGDIPPKISDTYNGDFNEIKNNLNQCIDAVNLLVSDAKMLADAAVKGALDTRADATKHQGDFRKIVEGVNETLDSVIGPLNVAAEYVDRISKGDVPPKITDSYNGDFNEIKNNLNTCIDAVSLLIRDAELLSEAAVNGKLGTRADVTKHQGDFRKIVEGVNDTIERLVGLLDNIPAPCMIIDKNFKVRYMNKAGTGLDNTALNTLLENNTQCYDHFRTDDCKTDKCSCFQAMKTGRNSQSATNAHPGKHNLDISYQAIPLYDKSGEIIGAFEMVIDQTEVKKAERLATKIASYQREETEKLTLALNMIAVGNLTIDLILAPADEETAQVHEVFSQIHKSLDLCVGAINHLITDANLLSDAAVNGKLGTRADASKHQGDFRMIIEGVNSTLDAVISPLKEGMRMADEYSVANFSARVDENLKVAGDYIGFKNSLNNIGISVQIAIHEIQRIADQYAKGNFAAEFDRSLKISGDLSTVRDGLDLISTDVSKVLTVVNKEMLNLSGRAENASAGIEDVARGAAMITKNADQTKLNAERSEDGITQVLQTMEDLTRTVSDVSINADRVADRSKEANEMAKKGIGFAGRADEGMQSITQTSEQVETIITEIRSQMNEIGKIVDLISDLANQTNLLSLNAAIEAARAGDAGRGFAVVAAEVKSLAQRSRQSAEHIADMISALQTKSEAASNAMATAGKAVADGGVALNDTLKIFNQLGSAVEDITKNMEMVASATEEQAASFEEITASVNEMSSLVKETSKDALSSSATSEEALSMVDQIKEVISDINGVVGTINTEMGRFRFKST
ncbi:MAG: methyl-accepting chemotaxis protein [Methanobacteriota archaeon]